ncbi:MAG: hypothetical protein ACREDR_44665 [Blastocatellia bacterium]
MLAVQLSDVLRLTERVMKQTRERVIKGNTHYEGKLVSIFEVETETTRKGKASKPTEFGKMVKIQEAENQIITTMRCSTNGRRITVELIE